MISPGLRIGSSIIIGKITTHLPSIFYSFLLKTCTNGSWKPQIMSLSCIAILEKAEQGQHAVASFFSVAFVLRWINPRGYLGLDVSPMQRASHSHVKFDSSIISKHFTKA